MEELCNAFGEFVHETLGGQTPPETGPGADSGGDGRSGL